MTASVPYELQCRELVELVTAFLDDVLPGEERASFEMHVFGCDGCRVYLDQIRQIRRAAGRLSGGGLGPGVRDGLLAVFHEWKERER